MEGTVRSQQVVLNKVIDILDRLLCSETCHDNELVREADLDSTTSVFTLVLELVQLDLALVSEHFPLLVLLDQSDRCIALHSCVHFIVVFWYLSFGSSVDLLLPVNCLCLFILPDLLCFLLLL